MKQPHCLTPDAMRLVEQTADDLIDLMLEQGIVADPVDLYDPIIEWEREHTELQFN